MDTLLSHEDFSKKISVRLGLAFAPKKGALWDDKQDLEHLWYEFHKNYYDLNYKLQAKQYLRSIWIQGLQLRLRWAKLPL